jgi:hypothetical protein
MQSHQGKVDSCRTKCPATHEGGVPLDPHSETGFDAFVYELACSIHVSDIPAKTGALDRHRCAAPIPARPSAHTMKAYRQDFLAIASLVAGGEPARMAVADITKESMRAAFAAYADNHEAALHPALLVHLECVVHLPLHRRAARRQPHATRR